jgi:hypothetical protein
VLFAGRRRNEGLGRSVDLQRFPPLQWGAPTTADVRRSPRRGTSSAYATKRMHPPHAREIVACAKGTRPSLGPSTRACRSSLCTCGAIRSVVGRSRRHHGWASPRKWEEPALGPHERTERGSPRVTASARENACHVRKGRRSRPPSPRGHESSGLVARTSIVVAEVGRRRLASNKLGKRAPKRAVRVE